MRHSFVVVMHDTIEFFSLKLKLTRWVNWCCLFFTSNSTVFVFDPIVASSMFDVLIFWSQNRFFLVYYSMLFHCLPINCLINIYTFYVKLNFFQFTFHYNHKIVENKILLVVQRVFDYAKHNLLCLLNCFQFSSWMILWGTEF